MISDRHTHASTAEKQEGGFQRRLCKRSMHQPGLLIEAQWLPEQCSIC
jgi:hypothetical protein